MSGLRDWHGALLHFVGGASPYHSRGIQHYIERDLTIPDYLLPGRALMRMTETNRKAIVKALNTSEPAPWWVKIIC